jgi:hypothetical protein
MFGTCKRVTDSRRQREPVGLADGRTITPGVILHPPGTKHKREETMKALFVLILFGGILILIGGFGAVAEQTYPAVVPVQAAVDVGATPGDPTLLILCVIAVVVGLAAGIKSGS